VTGHTTAVPILRRRYRTLVISVAALAFVIAAAHWIVREASKRAVLSRELGLFNHLHSAIMVYHMDIGQFPTTLEASEFQPYLADFRSQELAFLRAKHLVYTSPGKDSDSGFVILRASTPWGPVMGHKDGNRTYGWKP
jgi:hypothetical protein